MKLSDWASSEGVISYSPFLCGKRKNKQNWWVVVECDPEIGKYYRKLYHISKLRSDKLMRPAWKEHITVVRNEEPESLFKSIWGRYEGKIVPFEYCLISQSDLLFTWLNIKCEFLLNIREELGLARNPIFPLHMTIGNKKWDV